MGYYRKNQENKNEINKKKGDLFEMFVQSLFPNNFEIEQWTTDLYNKQKGIFVKSNMNPDFTIFDKKTKSKIAIECKFRSAFIPQPGDKTGELAAIEWAKDEQIKRYKEFEKKEKIPVFIIIGVSGTPEHPEHVFCIPLEEMKYPIVYESIFANYARLPNKPLFYKNGLLI